MMSLKMYKKCLNQSHLPILERSYPDVTGTVLAFDFGEKRIGVATGETMLKVAHPLTTINAEENEAKFTQIAGTHRTSGALACWWWVCLCTWMVNLTC